MKCFICNREIFGKYYIDGWDNNVCASHVEQGEVINCSSCHGYTLNQNPLSDGRVLCSVCSANTIQNRDDIQPIVDLVVKNLKRFGFNDLRIEDITIEVVSAAEMARIKNANINTQNKGLTLSKVNSSFSMLGGTKRQMQHSIYMLSHQTKIEFTGTLAHEMLHAWQIQNNITPPANYCEGLCNLGAYMMFSIIPGSLTKVLINNMLKSLDPIYGDGFREVLKMFEETGWDGIIDFYREKKYLQIK